MAEGLAKPALDSQTDTRCCCRAGHARAQHDQRVIVVVGSTGECCKTCLPETTYASSDLVQHVPAVCMCCCCSHLASQSNEIGRFLVLFWRVEL
jgi:hypothetical protein